MLGRLDQHATRPELTSRHRGATGDVVMRDNRSTLHLGVRDLGEAPALACG